MTGNFVRLTTRSTLLELSRIPKQCALGSIFSALLKCLWSDLQRCLYFLFISIPDLALAPWCSLRLGILLCFYKHPFGGPPKLLSRCTYKPTFGGITPASQLVCALVALLLALCVPAMCLASTGTIYRPFLTSSPHCLPSWLHVSPAAKSPILAFSSTSNRIAVALLQFSSNSLPKARPRKFL